MSKFKVGDRVRILRSYYKCESLRDGMTAIVAEVHDSFLYLHGKYETGFQTILSFDFDEVEPVPTNTIKLNETYTSKNGHTWECIAIKGDVAWLEGDGGDAYRFKLDGTNLSQGGGVWDIKFEPVVEWVEYMSDINISEPQPDGFYIFTETAKVSIRFPKIDGAPDFAQATVTPV